VYRSAGAKGLTEDGQNSRREQILKILDGYDAICLELAATAHYLTHNGYKADPWEETRRRKTVKATAERVAKAKRLLTELGL